MFKWFDDKPRPGILDLLYKADVQMLPGMFVGTIVLTGLIAGVGSFVGSYVLFTYFLKTGISILLILAVTGATTASAVVALPIVTVSKITGKKVKIDANLPFLLAYMATLSSAGMNPVQSIRGVAIKDFGPITAEFRKVVYRFDVLGEDIISSLNHVALSTPSPTLHDIMIGISNIVVSGGSLKTYCEQESKSLFDIKRAKLKNFIDTLAIYSEAYIGGIVVSIIMGVIGIILLGTLGIHILFFTTEELFEIFIFFFIPFANIVFLGMLEMKFSSGDI
jgi:archaeal flagellar protein FlaJ